MSRSLRARNHRQISSVVVKFTNNDSQQKGGVQITGSGPTVPAAAKTNDADDNAEDKSDDK